MFDQGEQVGLLVQVERDWAGGADVFESLDDGPVHVGVAEGVVANLVEQQLASGPAQSHLGAAELDGDPVESFGHGDKEDGLGGVGPSRGVEGDGLEFGEPLLLAVEEGGAGVEVRIVAPRTLVERSVDEVAQESDLVADHLHFPHVVLHTRPFFHAPAADETRVGAA